jgi:maleate isomerase
MATVATPQTLKALGRHIEAGAKLILPGSRVDVIGFSCTSGTVAVGPEAVRGAVQAARPGVTVCTPMEGGAKALRRLGCRRISLMTPYRPKTADLVAGYFREQGFEILSQSTFDLDGDPDMNRLSGAGLLAGARASLHPQADGLFISCTGLRTSGIVDAIERDLGVPVVTSNQALAWDCVRSGGIERRVAGFGRLFRTPAQPAM